MGARAGFLQGARNPDEPLQRLSKVEPAEGPGRPGRPWRATQQFRCSMRGCPPIGVQGDPMVKARSGFVRKVYGIVVVQLLVTITIAALVSSHLESTMKG